MSHLRLMWCSKISSTFGRLPTWPDMVMTLLSIYELLMNVQVLKVWGVSMFKYVHFCNILSWLCVIQLRIQHFICRHKEIILYLITQVNINVIMRLKGDTHSDSITNIDLTNSAFFFPKFVVLYLCFTFSPQACYSSIFGLYIMDAVWVRVEFGFRACRHCSEIE